MMWTFSLLKTSETTIEADVSLSSQSLSDVYHDTTFFRKIIDDECVDKGVNSITREQITRHSKLK